MRVVLACLEHEYELRQIHGWNQATLHLDALQMLSDYSRLDAQLYNLVAFARGTVTNNEQFIHWNAWQRLSRTLRSLDTLISSFPSMTVLSSLRFSLTHRDTQAQFERGGKNTSISKLKCLISILKRPRPLCSQFYPFRVRKDWFRPHTKAHTSKPSVYDPKQTSQVMTTRYGEPKPSSSLAKSVVHHSNCSTALSARKISQTLVTWKSLHLLISQVL